MAKKPESRLQRKIRRALEHQVGGWWRKIHGGPAQAAGIPDLLGCVEGLFFALEVKIPGGRLSVIQSETIADICAAGGVSTTVESPEEAVNVVQKALRLSKRRCRQSSRNKNRRTIR